MSNTFKYWNNRAQFDAQTELLASLFDSQGEGYQPGGEANISFETLGDQQRKQRIGCIYFAGGRIDNKFCIGAQNTGLLHSALPTDYPKAIRPAFHTEHAELMLCTHGKVVIEYTTDHSTNAMVITKILEPGEFVLIERGWPHKVSLNLLRASNLNDTSLKALEASFLAVKMGFLAGKAPEEDLTKWGPSRDHPLIDFWHKDQKFLRQIAENSALCEKLNINEEDLTTALGA